MKAIRLARRVGLDGNPLRRRTDRVAACLAALLAVAFLIGAPLLSVAAVRWEGHAAAAGQKAARLRPKAPAVPLRAVPAATAFAGGIPGYSRVPAGSTALNRQTRAGQMPADTRLRAGHAVPMRVGTAGRPASLPPSHRAVMAHEVTAAVIAVGALGITLLCVAWAGRWVLYRRRLAEWEAAWAAVGPQWTRRFRSRG